MAADNTGAMAIELSAAGARRLVLTAQGFGPRPAKVTTVQIARLLSKLGAIQIDAVNVLARSHLLPVFSRLGPYPVDAFDQMAFKQHKAFDFWGHAASYLPMELYPLFGWRRERHRQSSRWESTSARLEQQRPGYIAAVMAEITERGPLAFSDLEDPGRLDKSNLKTKYADSSLLWWNYSEGKILLETLYGHGTLAVAGRRNFERLYDLAERVIPPAVFDAPVPPQDEAHRQLVAIAARAMGVATVKELADYFRMYVAETKAAVDALVDQGVLAPAKVEGWTGHALVAVGLKPRSPADNRALLSPFDNLLWERKRNERLFGFRHSFEIYVPGPKRVYGYYVLPFLLGDAIVGRVDLKADRANRTLLVQGAHAEPGHEPKTTADALADELTDMAAWLGLERVTVAPKGDLAPLLKRVLSRR
ncbi:MAG: uncharacterized protein QOG03_1612 [Actinomycetota bacterium]|jgi:uncharacterized protein YcaQ|nr:uncharacterized protein [Actinomycetota bacterium]